MGYINPILLVRQSSLPTEEKAVLTPLEVKALIQELNDPFRTIVLLAAVTGLRRGELFGLKWEDVDLDHGVPRIVRSVVDQVEGPPKTLASRRPLPIADAVIVALRDWREQSQFSRGEDWIFASPLALGRNPYWPDAVLKRHVYPAAQRAGITKRIGWHTFRHTFATLLQSSGATMKTTQELMRHASPQITMEVYAKAVTADKRNAQEVVSAMFSEEVDIASAA